MRQGTDIRFAQFAFLERMSNLVLLGRPQTRPVISHVV
jgi:hypothetical protein